MGAGMQARDGDGGGRGLAFRLSSHTRPTDYRLHVWLDPERGRGYRGELEIDLQLARAARSIQLHSCELKVRSAKVCCADGDELAAAIHPHVDRETVELRTDSPLPKGRCTVRLRFSGKLRADLRGLYFAQTGGHRYAFTQLEAADARRFFPCFDEPAFKARFALTVTTAREHTVISNAPEASRVDSEDGQRTTEFEPTPLLSTYLVALAVGRLVGSKAVRCGKTPIRVWHAPGSEALTGFALEAARETLGRLEKYFAVPYPYRKLDLVAVPDFEFGAMENAGAVFFRETLLLIDDATVSLPERKRAAEVICHELAHMWYGNLVTMAWWDDLWLNEAFATWMAFTIVDDWKPQWRMWNDFGHARDAALDLDALRNTHPIYVQVRRPDEASENFDLITYEKGAAVVRMLERFLGESTFRRGVRNYIRAHREGNTVASDLWSALQAVSKQPGVAKMVRSWIEQPGFPLLRIETGCDADGHFARLRQQPYSAHGAGKQTASTRWAIPWVGRGGKRLHRQLLTRRNERVNLGKRRPPFLYGNADEGGFFRPLHSPEELSRLLAHVEALGSPERLGLALHSWALCKSGDADLTDYLRLVEALADEPDPDVLSALVGPLRKLAEVVAPELGEPTAERVRAWIVSLFGPALDALGLDGRARDDDDRRLRRALLVQLVGGAGRDAAVLSAISSRCDDYLVDPGALDGNLAGVALSLGAAVGDAARFDAYLEASQRATTPQERRRFRLALADFEDAGAAKRLVAACLSGAIPTQDVALVLARALGNPSSGAAVWTLATRRWTKLSKRMPSLLVSRFVAATPALGPAHAAEVAAFFKQHPVASAARARRQAAERFALDRAFRRRARPVLRRFTAAD